MPQLIDVLAEVLRAHGYTAAVDATVPGRKEGEHEIPLWVQMNDRRIAVDLWLDSAPPGKDYLQALLDQVDDVEADAGLLVNLGEEPIDVPESETGTILAVWDRHHVQTVLGRAVLSETCPGLLAAQDPLAQEELDAASLAPAATAPESETDPAESTGVFGLFDNLGAPHPPEAPSTEPRAEHHADVETPAAPPDVSTAPARDPEAVAGDFQELPGRAAAAPPAVPEASPDEAAPAFSDAEPEGDFEELPGRADEPVEPTPSPPATATGSSDFELLPGRPKDPPAPEHAPVVDPSSFYEVLSGRAAGASLPAHPAADADSRTGPPPARRVNPSDPAAALPTNPVVGNYAELPGRKRAETTGASPAQAVDPGGRPGADFQELPGRHDEAAPSDDAAPPAGTARDADLGEFRMPLPFANDEAKAQGPPTDGTTTAPSPGVLRMQVGPRLAANMVKEKVRELRDVRLRLVPFLVYEFEADVLLDGKLDAETKRGHVGVDAWMKRAGRWDEGFETAPLEADGVEIEKRQIRLSEYEGKLLALRHLEEIVGRDTTQKEDTDEWSVVVKKRVRFAGDDVRIRCLGTFWVPIWRLTGRDGSVEIDAATGQVIEEELLVEPSDSQLL
jgi:hypothetical protein